MTIVEEIAAALQTTKTGKADVSNGISSEMLAVTKGFRFYSGS